MLAAAGLTNKQIAERLFLSPRTVSTHLYQIYPKLGVTTRAGLRDALNNAEPPRSELPCAVLCGVSSSAADCGFGPRLAQLESCRRPPTMPGRFSSVRRSTSFD